MEQIDIAIDQEEADFKEQKYIAYFNTLAPNGYNLTTGGQGVREVSDIVRHNISQSHADVFGENNPMYGVKRPEVGEKNKLIKGKAVNQFTIDGIFVAQYPTIREAERQTGVDNS